MSVTTLVMPTAAAVAVALGAAALHTARGLRRQIAELHAELVAARTDAAEGSDAEAPGRRVHPGRPRHPRRRDPAGRYTRRGRGRAGRGAGA